MILSVFWAVLVGVQVAPGQDVNLKQFQGDLRAIGADAGNRIVGSDGYYRTAEYLRDQMTTLATANPAVQVQEQAFEMMVPVTKTATLTDAAGKVVNIYPLWPAFVRANTTPVGGIRGKLVYCKSAHLDEIDPAAINGQIAVLDAAAQDRWVQAAYFGASAIVILGSANTDNFDLRNQELSVPINVPRFYLPPGETAEAIRAGKLSGEVVLDADVRWQRKQAVNFYVLVKPAKAMPTGWQGELAPAAIAISVPYESSSLVPDLSPGASQAVNTAAALAMLRDAAAHPPARPMLFCFGGGDSIQFRATREMLMTFADQPHSWRDALNDEDVGVSKLEPIAEAQLARLNEVRDDPTKLNVSADRELLDRLTKMVETDQADCQDELLRLRTGRSSLTGAAALQVTQALELKQQVLSHLRFLLQKKPASLRDADRDMDLAKKYVAQAIERLSPANQADDQHRGLVQDYHVRTALLQRRIDLHMWLAKQLGLPADPDTRNNSGRLIELLIALDLSDRGVRVAPLTLGSFQRVGQIGQIQDYKEWLHKLTDAAAAKDPTAAWFNPIASRLDLVEPLSNSHSPQSWLGGALPIGSELSLAWGIPGLTLATCDDCRPLRDTPNDVLKLAADGSIVSPDIAAITPQLGAVWQLIRHAVDDATFRSTQELPWQRNNDVRGQVVGLSPNRPVPDLPRPGYLVASFYGYNGNSILIPRRIPYTPGIRRDEIVSCDGDGMYFLEGLPKLGGELINFGIEAFRIRPEDRGRISGASDIGQQAGALKYYANLTWQVTPLRSVVFDCSEFSLTGLYDPRFLQDLSDVIILDARRNDTPQRYNILISMQMMAGFVEPGSTNCLLFRYGRVGNRLVLLNMPPVQDDPVKSGANTDLGQGFTSEEFRGLGPLSLQTARDFYQLNSYRINRDAEAGFTNALIDDLHHNRAFVQYQAAAKAQAGQSDNAGQPATAADVTAHANSAWANEARVYSAVNDLNDDVVHAAIFLLLLCVPFSFCMERLLIGAPSIYKQITYAFLIFIVMTAALWSFHPAFKISSSPLIIILSFAIIFMSLVVISVVYGKFDTELKKIRSGRGTAEGASLARTSVLMSAVLLGIANMRKRKFRTALTSITIVLITFAVLCFTSSSTFLDITTLSTGFMPRVPSLMLRQRGSRPMPAAVLENLRAVLPGQKLVEHWWNLNAWDAKEVINVVSLPDGPGGKPVVFAAPAMLGLSPGESQLSAIADVIGTDRFAHLENGETNIAYISFDMAQQLKVAEGGTIFIAGNRLKVAGIFDAARMDNEVQMLDGEQITPLDYATAPMDTQGKSLTDNGEEALDLDSDASVTELSTSFDHISASKVVIVPAALSRRLPNASLRSVGLRLDDYAKVKPTAKDLAERFATAIFAGYEDGVRMVAANNSLPQVSGAAVAVPLAIAGLIIFNTMMGSIAERKREIHVYTSLGLAPMHVGALFVAEALTYGLIGTVFGYIIGQGVGTLMNQFHLLGNVTLNYSGTSAMMTMGLILLIVLMSALVPARLASQIAAPSIERNWRVPLPKDGEIMAHLPFTINKTAADGALAYLAEFFDAHKEGSIGKFSAGDVEPFIFEDEQKRTSRGLKTVIWLTPFDLGVRQHFMLLIHPGQFEDIYEVQVVLGRLSGDDSSWYRMNRSFLTELRKQFLQWRSLSPQRMLQYVEDSKRLFAR